MLKQTLFFILIQFSAAADLIVLAPYLPGNYEGKGVSGREYEIVESIFTCAKLKVQYDLQPYFRHIKTFESSDQSGGYDGILCVPQSFKSSYFPTLSYIKYHNGVLARKDDFPKGLSTLKDLKGRHVATFVEGRKLISGLEENIDLFASYDETSDQKNHVKMLLKKRVDAVISDGLIFMNYHNRFVQETSDTEFPEVKFFKVFKPTTFKASFKKKEIRDRFNECYEKLAKNGTLDRIEKKHAKLYKKSLGDSYFTPLLRN